jgi:hypothetical protein
VSAVDYASMSEADLFARLDLEEECRSQALAEQGPIVDLREVARRTAQLLAEREVIS